MPKYFTKDTSPVGFYSTTPEGIASVEISDLQWSELIDAQNAGKIIRADNAGMPFADDMPSPTPEVLMQIAAVERQARLSYARESISIWNTKLLMKRPLTESETEKLGVWMDYIDAVNSVDLSDPNWPDIPE
ncbi:tail fiber assembly protein [Pantoea agglomerans]|uniref:Tail fiber assembly protein n=1 Tax=Enterobacter agglomerans TaxID=549 RepID=A0ACC5RR88_ENTAG|nr:tail fiber assembly protein [Pantoea agglomerans]MBK4727180.1 tail fiber assembly protein [Pantoea agglomerans]